MDIETVESKLLEKEYKNKEEFIDDINLIFFNCLKYNGINNGTYNSHFVDGSCRHLIAPLLQL